tara:strand:- start:1150 stop:1593 length:444 start_codon:yes stop_codon:yes gene_type:complete
LTKINLEAATQAVASLSEAYSSPEERVLNPESIGDSLLEKMPSPTGWRLLILPYRGKGKTEGGVHLPQSAVSQQEVSTQVGYVLKVGELAYKDKEKFPNGPWCEQGDWVMFARYAGSRFAIDGGNVSILNDDEILARIAEPSDVLHY